MIELGELKVDEAIFFLNAMIEYYAEKVETARKSGSPLLEVAYLDLLHNYENTLEELKEEIRELLDEG